MISRATSGWSGVCRRSLPSRRESTSRHRPDEPALVADERAGQAELAGEPQRRRHHPPGDERDRDVALHGSRGPPPRCAARCRGRRRSASRRYRGRSAGSGIPAPGASASRVMPNPGAGPPCAAAPRGPSRPWHVQPGSRSLASATIASPWSAPISSERGSVRRGEAGAAARRAAARSPPARRARHRAPPPARTSSASAATAIASERT